MGEPGCGGLPFGGLDVGSGQAGWTKGESGLFRAALAFAGEGGPPVGTLGPSAREVEA